MGELACQAVAEKRRLAEPPQPGDCGLASPKWLRAGRQTPFHAGLFLDTEPVEVLIILRDLGYAQPQDDKSGVRHTEGSSTKLS